MSDSASGSPRVERSVPRDLLKGLRWDDPHITEARRVLQALAREAEPAGRRVFLVTSALLGEGKSTLCALLGLVAARMSRRRVLLIDADVRRPSLAGLLGLPSRPGLYEAMYGGVPISELIRSTALPTLFALPSGSLPGEIAREPMVEETFRNTIEKLRESYDLIIVDGPPILAVADSLVMASAVDGVLLVVLAGRTPLAVIRQMRHLLKPLESKIQGIILNNVTRSLPYYYDYRYYGYPPTTYHTSPGPAATTPANGGSEPAKGQKG